MISGVLKRFCFKPPVPKPGVHAELEAFTLRWCQENLTPLSPDTDVSFETWLESTPYPDWRKDELRQKWSKVDDIREKDFKHFNNKSFMKDETYPTFKHARAINSRSDEFKCYVGPFFKAIEKVLFALPCFIKKVPVSDRPNVIADHLESAGAKYGATDYTAFEAHFTPELMKAVEMVLYMYMTQYLPGGSEFMDVITLALMGQNLCKFKNFFAAVMATRMSGEMCTSLGNGFTNMIVLYFVCERLGIPYKNVLAFFEGDDGIFRIILPAGTRLPTSVDFADVGFQIKIEYHDTLSTASFCGLVFDDEDRLNVTDPMKVICNFGWTTGRYSKAGKGVKLDLLRCKALSLAHQYPGCPMVCALARYGLRVTRTRDVRSFIQRSRNIGQWQREIFTAALSSDPVNVDPPIRTRLLVESLYGISVETQLAFEKYMDTKNDLSPISVANILPHCHDDWLQYFRDYVLEVPPAEEEYPAVRWSQQPWC